ncbi:hypothetical protein FH972_025900 [Carpinus fangiana]|uniref:Rhodanese domain-containing protein n=1 Tax=Carpinus fangiana TaxID=176857 RepID=A0A5N6L4Y2_9ROSI|nr:hypothetical protein FH972_025900 [Carpinus fangiana]
MVVSRLQPGQSDPVSYICSCSAKSQGGGQVLLFYRYFENTPPLPTAHLPVTNDQAQDLAAWHRSLTTTLSLNGKLRIAREGFNVTVAGTTAAIETFIEQCTAHWSFAGLDLKSTQQRKAFFKPSPGCACVFAPAPEASVRVCAEITPLGITDYAPTDWAVVAELEPAEFHRRCAAGGDGVELMDLRNHYESRIGYFVSGATGQPAIRPAIRRFSQWPRYVKSHQGRESQQEKKQVLTYCTGGIRCEKATRWMAERPDETREICTLKGGIAAYLDWVDEEIAAGRMRFQDSLFRGKNYVFDARGAVGLNAYNADQEEPVSNCHMCGKAEDRLGKCKTAGCHLILVVCEDCEAKDARCCQSCQQMDGTEIKGRPMCECESARESDLWSGGNTGLAIQRRQKARTKQSDININVKIID